MICFVSFCETFARSATALIKSVFCIGAVLLNIHSQQPFQKAVYRICQDLYPLLMRQMAFETYQPTFMAL
jgi:hypothetical protein